MVATPLRVALDITPLAGRRTGIGRFVAALVEGLGQDPGIDVRGLALTARGRAELRSALPVSVPVSRPAPAAAVRWAWRHLGWPTVGALTGRVDVVHGTNYVVPPGGSAKELVSIHDLSAWRHPDQVHETSRVYPRLVERALARGAHVHADSTFVADELRAELGVPAERVHVVPLAAAPLPAPSTSGRHRLIGDVGPYVLAVGTVEPRKDYPGLVRAFAELRSRSPDLRLVIAGSAEWGSDALDAAIAACDVERSVHRLGFVSDQEKSDLLAGAELLAYPSAYEGFGLVPLEAMAAGVPVVATAVGSIPEICADAAALVAPGEPGALAEAMDRVISDGSERDRLVAAGRARQADFSWGRTVEEMGKLYRWLATVG